MRRHPSSLYLLMYRYFYILLSMTKLFNSCSAYKRCRFPFSKKLMPNNLYLALELYFDIWHIPVSVIFIGMLCCEEICEAFCCLVLWYDASILLFSRRMTICTLAGMLHRQV